MQISAYMYVLEKAIATHSSVLAWRILGTGAWWAAVYGVAQSQTRLTRLSSSSKEYQEFIHLGCCFLDPRGKVRDLE